MKRAVQKVTGFVLLALALLLVLASCGKQYKIDKNDLNVEWYDEETTEFTITTKEELFDLAKLAYFYDFAGQTFKLGNDIVINEGNAADWEKEPPEYEWESIYGFAGTFDGQGHTISGVYSRGELYFANIERVEGRNYICASLFRDTEPECVIKNLRIENSYFESDLDHGAASVSSSGAGTFDSIYSNAIIKSQKCFVGGIVGHMSGDTTVTNCWFDGSIDIVMGYGRYVGGIAARTDGRGTVTIEHCLSTAAITCDTEKFGNQLGGILGQSYQSNVTISDCLNSGTVSGHNLTGSAIGNVAPESVTTLNNVYVCADSNKKLIGVIEGDGKLVGQPIVCDRESITGVGGYQWTELDFANYWAAVEGKTPILKAFADRALLLDGVEKKVDTSWYDEQADSFVLENEADFYGFAMLSCKTNFEGKTVQLGADMKLNEGNASTWGKEAPENKWMGISTREFPFAGTFDGQGHTISGMYVKSEREYSGLFGATTQTAVVKRFRLVNSYFESTELGLGSIVGQAIGTFDTIYSNAMVTSSKGSVGGLIGRATEKPENTFTMNNCWFDGTVTNTANSSEVGYRWTGGLVGFVVTKATITNCLNSGTVDVRSYTAPNPASDGGSKHVQPYAGGLVGYLAPGYTVSLTDCLSVGSILVSKAVTSAAGSILGYSSGKTTLVNTYATKESSAFITRGNVDGTAILYKKTLLTGNGGYQWTTLDFNRYWAVSAKSTPILRSFAGSIPSLSGVERMVDLSWYNKNANAYTLSDAADLRGFALISKADDFKGKTVTLAKDIALNSGNASGWSKTAPGAEWMGIGTVDKRFAGTFDGKMHTVSGVYMNADEKYTGFFIGTDDSATVKNLIVKNSYLCSSEEQLGSIVGNAKGTFEKIYSAAIVESTGGGKAGGLIGCTSDSGSVAMRDCAFAGSVTITAQASYLGGLIGQVQNTGGTTIANCLNTGEVYHLWSGALATAGSGGFVGNALRKVSISNSVNQSNPKYTKGAGNGLFVGCGSGTNVTLTNCHSISYGKNLVHGIATNATTYPTCTRQNAADVAGLKAYAAAKVQNLFFSKSAKGHWVCSADSLPVLAAFASGSGAEIPKIDTSWYGDGSKAVYTLLDSDDLYGFTILSQVNSFKGKTVKLGADIAINGGKVSDWESKSFAGLYKWLPVGSTSVPFAGTFDGQGHTISGVYLSEAESNKGLFAVTGSGAVLQNLCLKNSYFTVENAKSSSLGSIVGLATGGTFEKIYSDATVVGGCNRVGGLIGTTQTGAVSLNDCWFAGSSTITAAASYLGGLIGEAQSAVTVANCVNTGEVYHKFSGTLGTAGVGGFAGHAAAAVTISDSVNHSNPRYTVGSYIGLLVGKKDGTVTLTNCHSILYKNNNGYNMTLVNGVSDSEYATCSRQNAADVAGTRSFTAAKVSTLFTSDSAKDHWVSSADSLPVLRLFAGEYSAGTLGIDTSWYSAQVNTYTLLDAGDLFGFAALSQTTAFIGKTVKLGADITVNTGTASDWASAAPSFVWTPVGSSSVPFAGTFDGQGHTISGLYITATESNKGLFAVTGPGAVIRDFSLKNSYFTVTNKSASSLGSIAGLVKGGAFEKIYSDAIVAGGCNRVGGLIGTIQTGAATLSDCAFDGSVTITAQASYLGGLIGEAQSAVTISNCLTTGEVYHKFSGTLGTAGVGGFVGHAAAAVTVSDSVNHSKPQYTVGSYIGLLVGKKDGTMTLTNCHSILYKNNSGYNMNLVNGVDDGTYATCSRQNAADVAGTKALTAPKVSTLFTSDSAKDHWICSSNSLPVLSIFQGEYSIVAAE